MRTERQVRLARKGSSDPSDYVRGGFRHGGRVKRTGIYRLHKGEKVIPARRSNRRSRRD